MGEEGWLGTAPGSSGSVTEAGKSVIGKYERAVRLRLSRSNLQGCGIGGVNHAKGSCASRRDVGDAAELARDAAGGQKRERVAYARLESTGQIDIQRAGKGCRAGCGERPVPVPPSCSTNVPAAACV